MKKVQLTRFIDKFYLGGKVNTVILHSKNNQLATRFWTGDKSMLGELVLQNWEFEETRLGIYDTTRLTKLMGVVGDDIDLSVVTSGDKRISLNIKDKNVTVNYMLADESVISTPPAMKQIPEFELKLKIDEDFVNSFISGKNALGSETETFSIMTDTEAKIVIGYRAINSNRIIIPTEAEKFQNIDVITFNADIFKEILVANKESKEAFLEVSTAGLARISFNIDDYSATYYLVPIQDPD